MRLRTVMTLLVGVAIGAAVVVRMLGPDRTRIDALIERLGDAFREYAPRGLAVLVEQATRWALAIGSLVVRQAVKAARAQARR